MRTRVGWAGHSVDIDPGWRVLDVGSGHAPNPRADVLLEMMPDDHSERAGSPVDAEDPRLVIGDALAMPFPDKSFDYVLATHVAEHVTDPQAFCRELARVGRAGYIETPGWFGDALLREPFHRWRVTKRHQTLVFYEVDHADSLGVVGEWFYAFVYAGRRRPGHRTLLTRNFVGLLVLTGLRYWLAAMFRLPLVTDLMYLRHEWRDDLHCVVRHKGTSGRATHSDPS